MQRVTMVTMNFTRNFIMYLCMGTRPQAQTNPSSRVGPAHIGRHKPDAGNKAFVLCICIEHRSGALNEKIHQRRAELSGGRSCVSHGIVSNGPCQTAQNRIGRNIKYRKFGKF